MAVGRAERWEALKPRAVATFGDDEDVLRTVAAQFALLEMAWHDVYGEVTPPDSVVEHVLICSKGTYEGLIKASRVAVQDRRDLHMWADKVKSERPASAG